MKISSVFISLILLLSLHSHAQPPQTIPNEEPFKSIFVDIKNGQYQGTVNGVLFIKNTNNKQTILDFQGGTANLKVIEDKEEVYDVSTKRYNGLTTSGKSKVQYRTYAYTNELMISLPNGSSYQAGVLDGACDSVIEGLNYYYQHEAGAEYLVLQVTQPITLNNYWPLAEAGKVSGTDDPNYKEQTIELMPNSVIVFVMQTTKY